jgi:3-hydroxybutyryl-CoA dehydrogenase
MNIKDIRNITVLGTGNMGPGIAFQFARAGYRVKLWGRNEKSTLNGKNNLNNIIDDMRSHKILNSSGSQKILSLVTITDDFIDAGEKADLIIEAVSEKLDLKQEIYSALEQVCSPKTIVASNTSTLLPTDLSNRMIHKGRFIVAHFWNPAYLAPLVELCSSNMTSNEVIKTMLTILKKIGNEPVLIRKEILGFIGNRIMHAMNREALALIGQGVCDPEDIDKVVLSSFGPRFANLGPMEYLDFNGLDLIRNIQGYLYADLDTTPGVLPIIQNLVDEGKLGVKSGKGLFDWSMKVNNVRKNRDREFYSRLKTIEKDQTL